MYSRPILLEVQVQRSMKSPSYRTMFNRTRNFSKVYNVYLLLMASCRCLKWKSPLLYVKLMSHGGSFKRKHVVEVFSSPCVSPHLKKACYPKCDLTVLTLFLLGCPSYSLIRFLFSKIEANIPTACNNNMLECRDDQNSKGNVTQKC